MSFTGPVLDNLFYTQSINDGRRWLGDVKVIHREATSVPGQDGQVIADAFYFHGMSAVHTDDGLLLVAIEHRNTITGAGVSLDFWESPPDSGGRAALAVLNYLPVGTSSALGSDVIFRGVGR